MTCTNITKNIASNMLLVLKDELSTVQFYLQSVNIPSFRNGIHINSSMGVKYHKPGDSLDYDDLIFDVLVDRDLKVYEELYNEMIGGQNPETGVLQPKKKVFQSTLIINSNKNNPLVKFMFKDTIIEDIGTLVYDTRINEKLVVTVSCNFDYFEMVRLT